MISPAEIRETAAGIGLELVSLVGRDRLCEMLNPARKRLEVWQQKGMAGEMRYMERPPELFTELEKFLPGVRTVASFALSYLHEPLDAAPCPPGHGRVARYAWGLDYHAVLKAKLEEFVGKLGQSAAFSYRIFSDSVPLLERAIASAGGLGFVGKNTLLIRPGVGSFTFLAEVLLTLETEELLQSHDGAGKGDSCGSCFRCAAKCPTGAIVSPRELDASKCISYLTIEKRTPFAEWESAALGEWVFGCDICQEVCPFNNKGVERSKIDEFHPRNGAGPFLDIEELFALRDDCAYRARFRGSAILRAKRGQLIRNACAVVANRKEERFIPLLRMVEELDSSELARSSAAAALAKLERGDVKTEFAGDESERIVTRIQVPRAAETRY